MRSELIPTTGEAALAWLEDLRDPLLVDLRRCHDESSEFREWLGRVGEDLVVRSEEMQGCRVRHVSRLSDSFGFDVESCDSFGRRCIEVKTTLQSAAHRFFITKNEVAKAAAHGTDWCLVQIVLHQGAAADDILTGEHVCQSRFLPGSAVLALGPADTATGVWLNSAQITPPPEVWSPWKLAVPASWSFPGYRCRAKSR